MASLWAGKPDPRPVKRYKATAKEWVEIREYFRGQPLVGRDVPYNPDITFHCLHHVAFKKADSGDDVIENLAPLLLADHIRFHDRSPGWEHVAGAMRQYVMVNNDRRRYAETKLGERFQKRYPPLPNTDPQFVADREVIFRRHADELDEVEGHG